MRGGALVGGAVHADAEGERARDERREHRLVAGTSRGNARPRCRAARRARARRRRGSAGVPRARSAPRARRHARAGSRRPGEPPAVERAASRARAGLPRAGEGSRPGARLLELRAQLRRASSAARRVGFIVSPQARNCSASRRLKREPEPGARQIRPDHAALRHRRAVEQHVLDADMVVEPFEMAEARHGAGRVQMRGRAAMAGEVDVMRIAQRRRPAGTR